MGDYRAALEVIGAATDEQLTAFDLHRLASSHAQFGDLPAAAHAAARLMVHEPGCNLADKHLNTELEKDADIEHSTAGLARAGLPAA